jgi:hypothetical protein
VLTALQPIVGDRLKVRVFEKDEAPDLMQRYLKEGRFESVPVFVVLDDAFEEAAVMYEHPADFDEFVHDHRRRYVESVGKTDWNDLTHDEVVGWVRSYRAYREEDNHQDEINQSFIAEIRRLIEQQLQPVTVRKSAAAR